jgi:hypothetical protein
MGDCTRRSTARARNGAQPGFRTRITGGADCTKIADQKFYSLSHASKSDGGSRNSLMLTYLMKCSNKIFMIVLNIFLIDEFKFPG